MIIKENWTINISREEKKKKNPKEHTHTYKRKFIELNIDTISENYYKTFASLQKRNISMVLHIRMYLYMKLK